MEVGGRDSRVNLVGWSPTSHLITYLQAVRPVHGAPHMQDRQ